MGTQVISGVIASPPGALRVVGARFFSFPVFLGALLVAGVFVCARLNPPEPDTWWHIAVGEHILTTGTWPTADFFSHTARGNHWIAYEWLGEVVMALAARGGSRGTAFLLISMGSAILLLLYYYCFLRCRDYKASCVACIAVLPLMALFLTLRPQLMGYILLLLVLICLRRFRLGEQTNLWILPVLFLLWVNIHGSFAFGLMAVGAYWISGQIRWSCKGLIEGTWTPQQSIHILLVALVSTLMLLVNPYRSQAAAYPFEMALLQPINIANIREWQPMTTDNIIGKVFIVLVLLFFLVQVLTRFSYRLEELGLLLFSAYSAGIHRRFLFVFLIFFTPVLAALLVRWIPRYQTAKDKPALNAATVFLIVIGMVQFFPTLGELRKVEEASYPRQAVDYLRQNPIPGPLFNEYGWGGYLSWAGVPREGVFIDGRADLYEYAGVLPDYLRVMRLAPDAFPLLRKYGIQSCLIRREDPLSTVLSALPDWERAYADELSVIYVHKRLHPAGPVQ